MDTQKMCKVFPTYFSNFAMPTKAKEQELEVYRACPTRKIEKASFLCTYEENGFKVTVGKAKDDPQEYGMSTCIRLKDVKRFVTIDSKYSPPYLLAKGITHPDCGKSCLTKDWKDGYSKKSSHVDYWLYTGTEPWLFFEEKDYETEQQSFSGGNQQDTSTLL